MKATLQRSTVFLRKAAVDGESLDIDRECSNLGMPFVLLGSDILNRIRLDFKYRQHGLTMWFGAGQHEVTHTNSFFFPKKPAINP